MAFCRIRTTSYWWILMLAMSFGWILTGSGSSQTRVPVGSLTKEDPCKRPWSFFFETIPNDFTETGSKKTIASGGVQNKQLKRIPKWQTLSPGILSQWLESQKDACTWTDAQISQNMFSLSDTFLWFMTFHKRMRGHPKTGSSWCFFPTIQWYV